MHRTALLAACLLAAAPALAQQRSATVPNPLANPSVSTAPSAFSGGNAPANPSTPAATPRASTTASATGANQFHHRGRRAGALPGRCHRVGEPALEGLPR